MLWPERKKALLTEQSTGPELSAPANLIEADPNNGGDWPAKRLAALAQLEILLNPSDLSAVLTRIVETTELWMPAGGGASILLWDADEKSFYLGASSVPGQSQEAFTKKIRTQGGASRWIIEHARPLIVENIRKDIFGPNRLLMDHDLKSYAGYPIVWNGEAIGVLYALERYERQLDEQDGHFMKLLTDRAAGAIVNAQLFAQLERLASQDSLTGLLNRRSFYEQAEQEMRRARRFGAELSALMIDVDQFKSINDGHGHFAGDELLKRVSAAIQSSCRDIDIVGRFGGDEFAVLLVGANIGQAADIVKRLQSSLRELTFDWEGQPLGTTISIGLAALNLGQDDLEALFARADKGLYQAKYNGRDCSVIYSEPK
jgi:diguanylate cyclase (GGDEF)-like protein